MGLLDLSPDQWTAIGLLGNGISRKNFSGGAVDAMGYLDQAPERKLKQQYTQAQLANLQSEIESRKVTSQKEQAALDRAARIQAGIPGLFQPPGTTGGAAQPQAEGGVPMFSRPMGVAPTQATPGGFDVQGALRLGMDPKTIAEYAALQNIGKPKVARTVKGTGPDGREFEYQVDEFGNKVGEGFAQYRAPITVNQGNKTTLADPYSLKTVGSFQTFQSPDSAASNAVTMRGQNMTDARARSTAEMGSIPSGYRRALTGGLEFIPGGPADPNSAKKAAPTEFQGKSTTYAARMQDAASVIGELEGKTSPANVARAGYKPEFPNWMPGGQLLGAGISAANKLTVPDDAQRYHQAQENWVTANLRQESGAAIGKDEMAKDITKWFPQPGDSDALKAQKATARKVAERAMVVQAGPGASSIEGIVSGSAPAQSTQSTGVDWKYVNGKLVKVK